MWIRGGESIPRIGSDKYVLYVFNSVHTSKELRSLPKACPLKELQKWEGLASSVVEKPGTENLRKRHLLFLAPSKTSCNPDTCLWAGISPDSGFKCALFVPVRFLYRRLQG
jgi:hypothetical protein